jgi:4-hydroxy-tetrahydrodipicolinate synthase
MDVTRGVFPVIVTPFDENGDVDFRALTAHVERITDAGVQGIITLGTTGEIATQTTDEQREVIETVVDASSVPVIAGSGTNSTRESVERTETAEEAGADGALVVSPYYNQPNHDGILAHYKKVADAVDIPIIPYNVPHRTGRDLEPDEVVEIAKHPNVPGMKDSLGDMNRLTDLVVETGDQEFDVMTGYDSLFYPLLEAGGTGVVSITGNLYPEVIVELYEATTSGETERAREIHQAIKPLQDALFCDTNPVPVKKAMELKGWAEPTVRLPLAPMNEKDVEYLESALERFERETGIA